MSKTEPATKSDALPRRPPAAIPEIPTELYEGVELAPRTLESLGTWDVCGHARREQDRLSYRPAKPTQGGY